MDKNWCAVDNFQRLKRYFLFLLAGFLLSPGNNLTAGPQPVTTFTYQGRLSDGGNPATGTYDLTFQLFADVSKNTALSGVFTKSQVGVSNGLFTVALDFGSAAMNGQELWLQMGVRTNGNAGGFVLLSPRQSITATPYAVYAAAAATAGNVATNAILNANVQDATLTEAKVANGQVVKSLNGMRDHATLTVGSNLFLSTTGNVTHLGVVTGTNGFGTAAFLNASAVGGSNTIPLADGDGNISVSGNILQKVGPNQGIFWSTTGGDTYRYGIFIQPENEKMVLNTFRHISITPFLSGTLQLGNSGPENDTVVIQHNGYADPNIANTASKVLAFGTTSWRSNQVNFNYPGIRAEPLNLQGDVVLKFYNPAPVYGQTPALQFTVTTNGFESVAGKVNGSLELGGGLKIKEGGNARMGRVTLVGGIATVNTTMVTANSEIFLTPQASGAANGAVWISSRTAGASFVISSSSPADDRPVAWMIVEPAP